MEESKVEDQDHPVNSGTKHSGGEAELFPRLSKELFDLYHEGFMIGHSYGPKDEYRVEISHRTLKKHQRFYELLYDLFNPTPLDCPMCDTPKSFAIYPYDPSSGYCSAEEKSWTVRAVPERETETTTVR